MDNSYGLSDYLSAQAHSCPVPILEWEFQIELIVAMGVCQAGIVY